MRAMWLMLMLGVTGCSPAPWGVLAGVEVVSIAVFGRGVGDIGVSGAERAGLLGGAAGARANLLCGAGGGACAGAILHAEPGHCGLLGGPGYLPGRYRGAGDTPPPTAAQELYRGAPWPKALTAN